MHRGGRRGGRRGGSLAAGDSQRGGGRGGGGRGAEGGRDGRRRRPRLKGDAQPVAAAALPEDAAARQVAVTHREAAARALGRAAEGANFKGEVEGGGRLVLSQARVGRRQHQGARSVRARVRQDDGGADGVRGAAQLGSAAARDGAARGGGVVHEHAGGLCKGGRGAAHLGGGRVAGGDDRAPKAAAQRGRVAQVGARDRDERAAEIVTERRREAVERVDGDIPAMDGAWKVS